MALALLFLERDILPPPSVWARSIPVAAALLGRQPSDAVFSLGSERYLAVPSFALGHWLPPFPRDKDQPFGSLLKLRPAVVAGDFLALLCGANFRCVNYTEVTLTTRAYLVVCVAR